MSEAMERPQQKEYWQVEFVNGRVLSKLDRAQADIVFDAIQTNKPFIEIGNVWWSTRQVLRIVYHS